jgi:hypothetical protein
MTGPQSDDPIAGTFNYDGRGYDDPRAATVAEFLHQLTVEARRNASSEATTDAGNA